MDHISLKTRGAARPGEPALCPRRGENASVRESCVRSKCKFEDLTNGGPQPQPWEQIIEGGPYTVTVTENMTGVCDMWTRSLITEHFRRSREGRDRRDRMDRAHLPDAMPERVLAGADAG
jgi:hypothetical protein